MRSREELKPCPFCGEKEELTVEYDDRCYYVRYSNCSARGEEASSTKEYAIKAWNTRKAFFPEDMEIDTEKLKALIDKTYVTECSNSCQADICCISQGKECILALAMLHSAELIKAK